MVRIRMQRLGRRNRPFYRIHAIDQRSRRNGRSLEQLGWYDPVRGDDKVEINVERVKHWLSVGAQPSETVRDLLAKHGVGDVAAWESERKAARDKVEAKKAAEKAAAEAAEAAKAEAAQ
ncbi:MAG: 30S ribosomal protein S16 [Phycisphaeraceae bacterium]|nr:30S ribosomal protein S16 [Phycisphaeraceae bacterium]